MTSCGSADGSNKSTADVDVCSGDTKESNNPLSFAVSEVKGMHSVVGVGMQMMCMTVGGVVLVAPIRLGGNQLAAAVQGLTFYFSLFNNIMENGNYLPSL